MNIDIDQLNFLHQRVSQQIYKMNCLTVNVGLELTHIFNSISYTKKLQRSLLIIKMALRYRETGFETDDPWSFSLLSFQVLFCNKCPFMSGCNFIVLQISLSLDRLSRCLAFFGGPCEWNPNTLILVESGPTLLISWTGLFLVFR